MFGWEVGRAWGVFHGSFFSFLFLLKDTQKLKMARKKKKRPPKYWYFQKVLFKLMALEKKLYPWIEGFERKEGVRQDLLAQGQVKDCISLHWTTRKVKESGQNKFSNPSLEHPLLHFPPVTLHFIIGYSLRTKRFQLDSHCTPLHSAEGELMLYFCII